MRPCSDSPSLPLVPRPEGCPRSLPARYTGSQLSVQAPIQVQGPKPGVGDAPLPERHEAAAAFWRLSQPQNHGELRAPHRPVLGSRAVPDSALSRRTLGDRVRPLEGPCSGRQPGELLVLSSSSGPSTPASSCGVATLTTPTFARPRRALPWTGPCVHLAR